MYIHYERRRPEETVLYQLVQEYAETLFAQVGHETGAGLSEFVKEESEAFFYTPVRKQTAQRIR